MALAIGVCTINNHAVLEEHYSGSTEDARVVTTLRHTFRSSDYRPGQAVVVAKAGGVNTFSNRGQLQVHGSQGWS